MPEPTASPGAQDLLLFEGGPFFRLLGILGEGRLERGHILRVLAASVLITWAPMALLAAAQGLALGPSRSESMLLDAAMYARFWVALPLLILTNAVCGPRISMVMRYFLESKVVRDSELERFHANVDSAARSARSGVMELLLLLLAFLSSAYLASMIVAGLPSSWRLIASSGQATRTWAGWWFVAVSQPLYAFIELRLLYRLLLWWRLLWRTSRLNLSLNPSHPDGAGGLAFLSLTLPKFAAPAFAISASLAGGLANLVLGTGITVAEYRYTVLGFAVCIVALFAAPLLFFYDQLKQTKVRGKLGFGWLSKRQLSRFEEKWVDDRERTEGLLELQDFSAVIDLTSTVQNVHNMSALPLRRSDLMWLAAGTVAPFLPVMALEIPVHEILQKLMKLAA